MSMDNQDRLGLVQYRLAEAKDTQSDVELLISHDRLRAAINRIYYSMKDFNSAIERFINQH